MRKKAEPFVKVPLWWIEETARLGVSRDVKRRVLRDLERARVIMVERPPRKTPRVTLVVL